jgi:membrane protein
MSPPGPPNTPAPGRSVAGRVRGIAAAPPVAAARTRYEGSSIQDLFTLLKSLDLGNWTMGFGAQLLWSTLPLLILLSSLASGRIDDDLSRHLGLDAQGARVIRDLFRHSPTFSLVPIATGLLFALAGTIAVVSSIQVLYERVFDQPRRGWRDYPRLVAWLAVLLATLIGEGLIGKPVLKAIGPVIMILVRFLVATLFLWWTMHFLLAGRTPWRVLFRAALVTAALWLVLYLFSSLSFSDTMVSDSNLYGAIGAVFTLLTWFVLIATALVLGAAFGAVWQRRAGSNPHVAGPAR